MNTEDFKPFEYKGDSSFEDIFKLQKELFLEFMKYEPTKLDMEYFDINTYFDQQIIKDFLQIRFIEELTEATVDTTHRVHFLEEITDAFNFLIEAYIIYGYSYKDLTPFPEESDCFKAFYVDSDDEMIFDHPEEEMEFRVRFYDAVEAVGKACNVLKNRPWRNTQYLTDLYKFEPLFKDIWNKFIAICEIGQIDKKLLFETWSKKYQCNKFRIDSNY